MQDEQAREVYEVWTITVRVSCGGVSRLELRGPLLQDVWISDAFVLNDDGRNVNLVPAGAIKNAHTFRLVIGTCEIEVSPSLILDGECACSGTPATPYIGHLESGKRHPSDKVLGQLAKVLALDPRELFFRGNPMALEFVRPKDRLTSSPPGSNSARTHVSAACIT